MRTPKIHLACILLFGLVMTVHNLHIRTTRADFGADFKVYYTAAALVLNGQTSHLYDGANTGEDPQLKFARPGTVYTAMAQSHGLGPVRLYVYPPILADLLVPFAAAPEAAAEQLWLVLNLLAVAATAWMTARLVGLSLASLPGMAVLVGYLALLSTGFCIFWGQITIGLLLLWAIGIFAYSRDQKAVSAFALALATSIKLTPLLVVAPLLLWQDWRWLRSYALSLAALVAAMCAINRPALLAEYFQRVTPAMSRGIPVAQNKSLVSFVQLLYIAARREVIDPFLAATTSIPHNVLSLAKLLPLLAVLAVLAVLGRSGRALALDGRLLALALLALVSTCASPVAWKHAYVVAGLPLALLWARALRQTIPTGELVFLSLCSIELGTFFLDDMVGHLHGGVLATECALAPAFGIGLALFCLRRSYLRRFTLRVPHAGLGAPSPRAGQTLAGV